ncbi:50S ribosomal protein L11 methyltransferase [Flavitalea sp. BT771]|uniref:50S ribosomal protein L11 methyltransferase n=1 Tax=Flavitalea sp. BT771 TaxID=3063329 RepID=UPI0026E41B5B|nr:50S ribosomal protein L11 methyltransferase [Flavitalea sp. BT771]MDO6434707.1 50S ribosomal protein L11 methyltransferase [Flavitalea sp. BT771]MDV6223607.1 50S ribosomal protein L11 methyltransferase [Flavitalea sp. BT771]
MHLQITIPAADLSIQEILIARLEEQGYDGFLQESSHLQAYIPDTQFDARVLEEILSRWQLSYTRQALPEKNWNEEWEKNFQPVIVGKFCAIRASFHAPIPDVRYELVITPKMSFGTGHHATTHMMIQAMENLDLNGCTVLDFGTGTGVLAILAEKLGAGRVIAIDHDPWSIENARENMVENHVSRVSVEKLDTLPGEPGFDVILANINKHVILKELAAMKQQLKKGGVILLSGLLVDDFQDIESESLKNDLSISERLMEGSWICLKLRK